MVCCRSVMKETFLLAPVFVIRLRFSMLHCRLQLFGKKNNCIPVTNCRKKCINYPEHYCLKSNLLVTKLKENVTDHMYPIILVTRYVQLCALVSVPSPIKLRCSRVRFFTKFYITIFSNIKLLRFFTCSLYQGSIA